MKISTVNLLMNSILDPKFDIGTFNFLGFGNWILKG